MQPNIPVPVWEQIAVVIIFSFLLGGLGWGLVRLFIQAIADVNAHYAALLKDSNQQWQTYFDARVESNRLVSTRMMERVDETARQLTELARDFDAHDRAMRESIERPPISRERKHE
jgi:hypothetical protein